MTFEQAWQRVAGIEGWLTEAQGRRLWERMRELRPGQTAVEIGSFRGRSAALLAQAAADGVALVAIDPHGGTDRGPREITTSAATGEADHQAFLSNLERVGVRERVRHVRSFSSEARVAVEAPLALLYVDGAHRYGPARDDLRDWGARVEAGGTLLVHDSFSSIGVTLALVRLHFAGHRFRYAGRTGSLAEYRREDLRGGARVANALRQAAELPWFARNVLVKVALVTRLRPLARLLGHRSGDWPY